MVGRIGETVARLRLLDAPVNGVAELGRLLAAIMVELGMCGDALVRDVAFIALHGLDHDGSEAYLVDVPTPVKLRLPDYKLAERSAQAAVVAALVPAPVTTATISDEQIHALVKCADTAVLLVEKRRLLTLDLPDWSPGLPRDYYWQALASAVVSAYPGSMSEAERRCYLPHVLGHSPPPDPHSPLAVESAFYHAHAMLAAIVNGADAEDAVRDLGRQVAL